MPDLKCESNQQIVRLHARSHKKTNPFFRDKKESNYYISLPHANQTDTGHGTAHCTFNAINGSISMRLELFCYGR